MGYRVELQGECPCVGNLFACMENDDCPAILKAFEQGAGSVEQGGDSVRG